MKEAYIPYDLRPGNALAERLLQPDVEIANLTALREADQATIAALGLVNKELADALEIAWRAGRFVDAEPAVVDRAERALRAAGRLKGENDA